MARCATGDGDGEPLGREQIRVELERVLAGFELPQATMLGAGTDDIEPARRFLSLVAPGGWVVPRWPVEYGGRASSEAEARGIRAELNIVSPDLYPFQVGLSLVGPALLIYGTREQCKRFLIPIRDGSQVWCQLFSEPEAGSDLAGLRCRADRVDGGWRVTGSKVWSSRAHYADRGLLLARFDPTLPKHQGIVALMIDMRAAGVLVRPLRQMNGDTHFNEVFLDDVFVPDTDRLAAVGDGWTVARTVLGYERQSFGAEGSGTGVGLRKRLLMLAAAAGVNNDPVLRDWFARVWCDLEIAKLAARRAGALTSQGRPEAAAAGAGGKLRMARNLRNIADLALAVQGPGGAIAGTEWQEVFLTAPSMSIRGGTDEIIRNTIGEQVLGLPKEPKSPSAPARSGIGAS
jgi:alkylation response protein AidB-like acyl-CoA dehydrogenase